MHGIAPYTILDVCEKITSFCQALKNMHTKENCFLFLPQGVLSSRLRCCRESTAVKPTTVSRPMACAYKLGLHSLLWA